MADRLVTDEQLDELVEARMAERRKVVEEVVAALQPQLEGIRREAASANHVKRTLGRQLTQLQDLVRQSNAELRAHGLLPFHPAGADAIKHFTDQNELGLQLLEDFGVATLSLEEKRALPAMLSDHVQDQKEHVEIDRRSQRRQAHTQVITTAIGSLAGAVVAMLAVLGFLRAVGVIH